MNDYQSLATTDISEITRPRSAGKVVDPRVVHAPSELQPDYDRMRKLVHGRESGPLEAESGRNERPRKLDRRF